MKAEQILMAATVTAAAAITKQRFVDYAGAVANANAVLGVANASYDAGEQAGVSTHGLVLVEAGGAVSAGAQVQSDATGRAITLDAGVPVGRAVDAATGAGALIRVKL